MQVFSMTGYGVCTHTTRLGQVTFECRSVNSRFLDLTFRLPEELRSFEPLFRERLQQGLQRGKVEVKASLKANQEAMPTAFNEDALMRVLQLQDAIRSRAPQASPLSVAQLMGMNGILNYPEVDQEALEAELGTAIDDVIRKLSEARAHEGAALKQVLLMHADTIDAQVNNLKGVLPQILANIEAKLEERLTQALSKRLTEHSTLTPEEVTDRIRQEVTFYAVRMDVEEEINRLLTHTQELRRLLDKGGALGRRLDFIVQEMNREANTLGSKASAIEMTETALNLKVAIEQMREQIQNLE